jgi:hypothetical protein
MKLPAKRFKSASSSGRNSGWVDNYYFCVCGYHIREDVPQGVFADHPSSVEILGKCDGKACLEGKECRLGEELSDKFIHKLARHQF